MKPLEINNYILRYIKANRTHSAIMLTGGWGTGKSYYIQNTLIPFLKENSIKCATLSLYGLNTLSEVSKNLYWEIRAQFLPDSEAFMTGKTIAKTILRGAASAFNIDISPTDEDLKNMYRSVNLSEKLIILEDLERCKIPIFDILGYVNSLVEQDNVKVLLVSNEDEFIKRIPVKKDNIVYKSYTEEYTTETTKYLATKEKTVSDTIKWLGNPLDAIPSIIKSFNNEFLSIFAMNDSLEILLTLSNPLTGDTFHSGKLNLRTFIFARQKTCDIFSILSNEAPNHIPDIDFKNLQCIFFSIIIFSYRIKNGIIPPWNGTKYLSSFLSSYRFLLYSFCYEYIKNHHFNFENVSPALLAHHEFCVFDERSRTYDPDISIIESYAVHSELDVFNALNNLNNRLSAKEAVPFYYYGKLPFFLIQLHALLDYDYQEIKEKMIRNCAGLSTKLDQNVMFLTHNEFDDPQKGVQYNEFKNALIKSINSNICCELNFDYTPSNLSSFLDQVDSSRTSIQNSHVFISQYDNQKLLNMLTNCSSEQIYEFRTILHDIYHHAKRGDYSHDDLKALEDLLSQINSCMEKELFSTDRIIHLQLHSLCDDLKTFISQLST